MKCPTDSTVDLVMSDRQGIEIDYCPTCRGVWLDRGELDKIIERSTAVPDRRDDRRDDDDHDRRDDRSPRPAKKKRSSMLGELFDF
jgi:Zn-finger nucleic acid-binding protein